MAALARKRCGQTLRVGVRAWTCDREPGHKGVCAAFLPTKTVVWRPDAR